MTDPYEVGTGTRRAFWADAVADEVLARDPTDPVVVKGGVSRPASRTSATSTR